MPTYSYACKDCDHRFDMQQAFADEPLTTCPVCGGGLRKVYGSVGVVFKGSGFYRTDSRSGSSSGKAAPESGPAKPAETSSAGSEPKSATGSSSGSGAGTSSTGKAASAAAG